MTNSYTRTVHADAPPDDVVEALTTLEGLAAWWTPTVTGSPTEGGHVSFHFDDQIITMKVEHARADLVRWHCLGHSKFPEWSGTILTMELVPESGTTVHFEHAGLRPSCDCYAMCSNGWDHYLGSLVDHVEGGPASPWRPATSQGPSDRGKVLIENGRNGLDSFEPSGRGGRPQTP